jgi:hypothetical protein
VLKWRADGTLDTSIGPFGLRSYSLDFAGPNPSDDNHNFDRAFGIARQGDGKYVILGQSESSDGHIGVSLVRLTHALALDPTFGNGGKVRYLSEVGGACTNVVTRCCSRAASSPVSTPASAVACSCSRHSA